MTPATGDPHRTPDGLSPDPRPADSPAGRAGRGLILADCDGGWRHYRPPARASLAVRVAAGAALLAGALGAAAGVGYVFTRPHPPAAATAG